jgi:microcystin synthetase protein McyJ
MVSQYTQDVAKHYTQRHGISQALYGNQPYANYGYWPREGMTIEQASDELTDLIARTAGMGPGDRVLDVGCGYGANAVTYCKRYHPAAVVGIDVTEVRIEKGREYVATHGLGDVITLQLGDATKLGFEDASFDRVIAVESAFHFDTRRDFLNEAARVLKPGGTLALSDMIPRRGVDPKSYMTGHRALASGVCLEMPVNAYDADVYEQYLREAGFAEVRIESILEKSRKPFYQALEKLAQQVQGPPQQALLTAAKNIRQYIDGGEDYILVFARKG